MIFSEEEQEENLHFHRKASILKVQALRALGIAEDQEIPLKFTFESLSPAALRSLLQHLKRETDYVLRFEERKAGYFLHGETRPTRISYKIVEEWVFWMCSLGAQFDCLFEGWDAKKKV
ncbi:MAG: hypothetical protein ACYTHM_10760 [Planctomycetota bacterium]|jgi:hypothetical protein